MKTLKNLKKGDKVAGWFASLLADGPSAGITIFTARQYSFSFISSGKSKDLRKYH